ncbi:hypothetical protein GE061_002989 [Apolygus lucorum]|uniref:Nucleoprotein TPR n=1 Tax=Apolygus lucorum TaxID=248454 RepID=A0A8S9X2N0_APOLU|nr:hypothetical protein GE061_002989 [Apolygus lucorum]
MDVESGSQSVLEKSLSTEEYQRIDGDLRGKIENLLEEHVQDYLTAKACFETTRTTLETRVNELEALNQAAVQERDEFKTKWEGITVQYEDTNKRLSVNYAQLNKHRDDIQRLEKELAALRRERDEAVDERQVSGNMLERREVELERLRSDIAALNTELRAANHAKLEALTLSEDTSAKLVDLEFKEKRFETERSLLSQQIEELTLDLGRSNEDLAKQRRESTSTQIGLQTKISELEEELRISKELNGKLTKNNDELQAQLEEVTKKMKEQMETEDRLVQTFQNDLKAQTKLTDLYKERVEEAEHRASELSTAVKELQRLLKEASDHSGDLETRLAQQESDLTAELEAKQEAINALKEELRHANILLEAVKQESSEAAVSRLSPMAASASKLLKSGLTLTQLYTKYAESMQELLVEKQEKERLKEYIEKIMKEIEEKSPILAKQQEDYVHALTSMEVLTQKVDDLENEQIRLRRANAEIESTNNFLARENKKHSGTINDLGRQVCLLLREVEAARGNIIPLHDTSPEARAEARTSSEVIAKHLVTFKNLKELQLKNQQLLAAIHALGASQESVELDKENEKVKALKSELDRAEGKIGDLVEREKFLQKELDVIKNQRDVYHRLFRQHVKPGTQTSAVGDVSADLSQSMDVSPSKQTTSSPSKPKTSEEDEKSFKIVLEELKKEYNTYREEKKTNEKVLNDTIAKLRDQLSEMVRSKAEVSAQAEFYQEKVKALAKKVESLTAEVESLEKRCQNYVNAIGKHEFNVQHLRNEAMEAINKLSLAETQVANLTQENRALRDSERRLQKERETERKEKHGQELLMANLEALKAKFDCSEADSRMRLEARLDEANVECSNLRRRLQDEQDRLTRRVELLEEQTRTAKTRLEEEKALKTKVAEELEALRNEMREKEEKIEEMQEQLTTAINSSQPVLERESRIKELDTVIRDKDATINSLNERLAAAKKCQAELSEVSQGIEKQLTELTEQYEQHKQESDKAIEDLKKVEAELKSANLSLELKLKTSNAEETEERAQREAELSSLRSRCEGLANDLEKTKQNEMVLEKETKEAVRTSQVAEEKASNLSVQTNQLRQELDTLRVELVEARSAHTVLEAKYSRETEKSRMEMTSLNEKIAMLEKLRTESEEQIKEFTAVNDLLHEQIQELGQKVTIIDNAQDTGMDLGGESLTSESFRQSDKMLQVLRLLRKEKSSAIANAEFQKNEKQRMEAEVVVLKKQLEELRNTAVQAGPSSEATSSIAAERHAQLLTKVETLNELTENNKLLREDRDKLKVTLAEVEKSLASMENEVLVPNQKKIASLVAQVEQLQTENTALKADNQRWRDRTNELIEKHNKNPDEMKRLLQEKDNLMKQLGAEKEQHKLLKSRLEEQLLQLRKEKEDLFVAHNSTKEALNAARLEVAATKDGESKATERANKLQQDLTTQETTLQDLRSKEMQIRQIAKKYKIQYQELTKALEEKNKAGLSQAAMEEAEERVRQLSVRVASLEAENESLRRENNTLKAGNAEREERAKTVLKNTRSRCQTLTEENKALSKELADIRRIRGPGESSVADTAQIRNLESRISRLEKEKEDEVNEKDRLVRELEILNQRLGIMQRQLEKYQQGAKPSTSGGEKSSSETPTANIKPLSGPSTSTSKQTQLAQAATVMPWRETPFASIRPMASQPRSVVVLPPRQSGSTSSQPVLVAPQQQVVHTSSTCEGLSSSPTSSHIDYMPASSCALNIHQNSGLSVIIGQHMEAEAGNEDSVPPAPAHHVQPNQNAAVALVLPQPTAQQPSQAQGEAASTESVSGVVSASNQEQVSEQSVSASNHSTIGMVWSRNVDEPSGAVASSQIEQGPSSVAGGSGSSQPGCSTIAASSQQAASSTTSVTTSVAPVLKRPSPDDADSKPHMPAPKRSRLLVSQGEGSGEMLLRADGLEVEYQVPTSSQRDQEDDILVVSDDDDLPDDGAMDEGQEFEEEGEEEARYGIEAYSRDGQDMAGYEEGDGPDIDEGSTTDQDNNEVDIIEDSNEVPNQCESTRGGVLPSAAGGSGSVVEGSATTGGEATSSLGSTTSSQDYQRGRRHHMVLSSYEDPGDDSIVPSTPTLFVPRRADGFGEAVSSPHVPSARFTFADPASAVASRVPVAGVAQVASEGMDDTRMDLSQLDEGTGRSVPTTPSHVSPQDPSGPEIGQSSSQDLTMSSGVGIAVSEGSVTVPDAPLSDPQEAVPEDGCDGVTSEGEKSSSNPPGLSALQTSSDADVEIDEAEGREAEASPAATSSSRGNTARRTIRLGVRSQGVSSRGGPSGRSSAPTPIVWSSPETQQHHSHPTGPQNVTMVPLRDVFIPGGRMRGLGPSRGERPTSGFRGRPRRRMGSPYHPANFGPRF